MATVEEYYFAMLEFGNYIKIESDVLEKCEEDGSLIVNTVMVDSPNKTTRFRIL